jgi:hypothetical protein
LAIWAAGAYHLTARLGVGIAPGLTPNWLYPRIVRSGLWVFVHAALGASHWWPRGIVLSLAPSAIPIALRVSA